MMLRESVGAYRSNNRLDLHQMLEGDFSQVSVEAKEGIHVFEARPVLESVIACKPRGLKVEKRRFVPVDD